MDSHRVLIVEDDEVIRESIMEFLQDHGYDAVGAVDGSDALEKLGACTPLPCLIILDLMMPVMDGISFRQEQLRDPNLCAVPVVVVSAYKDISQQAKDLNATAHLAKPLKLAELLQVVQQHCPRTAAQA